MHYRKTYLSFLFAALLLPRLWAQEDTLTPAGQDQIRLMTPDSIMMPRPAPVSEDLASPEQVSLALFIGKQWPQLAGFCEKTIRSGIDAYYLRVRGGIACFEMKQYRKAVAHLQKALRFNPGDDLAGSYLYYAYLYSERFEEAKWLSKRFSVGLSTTMNTRHISPVDFAFAETGIKQADSSHLFKNPIFSSVGISHSIGRRVFLFHSLSYYSQGEYRFYIQQFQYYLKATLPLANNWRLSAAGHLVNVDADLRNFEPVVNTFTYLTVGPPPPPGQPPPQPVVASITTTNYVEKMIRHQKLNSIGALALSKHMALADVFIGTTYAHLDTSVQYQLQAGFMLYPLKNNRLGLGATIYQHSEEPSNKQNTTVAPLVTAYITGKIHLAVAYLSNAGPNITENTGYFVSNSTDYTLSRLSATASFNVAKGLWLYGTGGYEQKKQLTDGFKYNYSIAAIGLKIIP